MGTSSTEIQNLIRKECEQDSTHDDVTCRLLEKEGQRGCTAIVRSREEGVFCGEAVCEGFQAVFAKQIQLELLATDGRDIKPRDTVASFRGTVSTALSLERTLLNLLSHLCGVATQTRRFVRAVDGLNTRILATRKTLPGLRELQLMAVRAGGGFVHRRSLSDGILIKDNHLECVAETEILARARRGRSPLHGIEIEVQSLKVLPEVLANPPDVIMLDNLSLEDMARAIKMIDGKSAIEASGGISLETVRAVAELGVDYISVGQLTHSVRALDLTMDIELQ